MVAAVATLAAVMAEEVVAPARQDGDSRLMSGITTRTTTGTNSNDPITSGTRTRG